MEAEKRWVTDPDAIKTLFLLRAFAKGDQVKFAGQPRYDTILYPDIFADYSGNKKNTIAWRRPVKHP